MTAGAQPQETTLSCLDATYNNVIHRYPSSVAMTIISYLIWVQWGLVFQMVMKF